MTQLVRRRLAAQGDQGFTLIEVMIAMLTFALVSVGVIHTMISVISIGRDSQARQVASNLAAQAVDRSREEADIFALLDGTSTTALNGDTFTVERRTAWVSDPSAQNAPNAVPSSTATTSASSGRATATTKMSR